MTTDRIHPRAIEASGYDGAGTKALHDDGTWKSPGGGSGVVETIIPGDGIAVDSTDPANPVVSATGGGSTDPEVVRDTMAGTLVAGSNITITPDDAADTITISAASGGGAPAGGPDDPAYWGTSLGYDVEFNGTSTALPTGWRWENQGAATYQESGGAAYLAMPTVASGTVRAIVRPLPTQASWSLISKFSVDPYSASYWGAALVVLDSATGRNVQFGPSQNAGWRFNVAYWTSIAGAPTATHPVLTTDTYAPLFPYWRITKNSATSWDFQVSYNGRTWRDMSLARNITTHTANPTDIGIALWASGQPSAALVDWFRVR